MLHHMPMIIQNPLHGRGTLHSGNPQHPGLAIKHRTANLAKTGIQLGVLAEVDRRVDSECCGRIGEVVVLEGFGTAYGGFFDHLDCVGEDVFAGAEPSGEAVGFAFFGGEGVDCVAEFASAFGYFGAEF